MTFDINVALKQSVASFSWALELNKHPTIDVDDLVREVSNKIITASQVKPFLETKANRSLSLVHICYLVVQNEERFDAQVIINRIQQASPDEKIILNHSFQKLSQDFVLVQPDDLKAITLLFGIQRVHELAIQKNLVVARDISTIEQLETTLNQLIILRNRYDINSVSEAEKSFLLNLDTQIQEKRKLLESLKKGL